MNTAASRWAWQQHAGRPSDKLVLLALAMHANVKSGLAWPSIAALSADTGMNRKQVIPALDRLEAAALIADSGQRQGRTRQIKVYRLCMNGPADGPLEYPIGDC